MANPKNAAWYGIGLVGILPLGAQLGNVFYVDGTGPDTNDGLSVDTPLASITAALALCTANMHDVIVVLDYWAAATEVWPIACNVAMVTIVGCMAGAGMWPQVNPPGDTAAFSVTGLGTHISGLSINGGASHGAIEIASSEWGQKITNCWFGEAGTAQDGIRVNATFDAVYMEIYDCRFGAGLTRSGVRIDHNATRGRIGVPGEKPNWFRLTTGIAIHVNNAFAQGGIFDNRIALAADASGRGITLDATSSGVHVDGNHCHTGNTAMAQNPYRDLGASHWGINYVGAAATLPVTV